MNTADFENMTLDEHLFDQLDFSKIISPEQVILGLKFLKAEQGLVRVDYESISPVMDLTLSNLWMAVRQKLIHPCCPLAESIFESLEWFRASGVRPDRHLVLAFAVELFKKSNSRKKLKWQERMKVSLIPNLLTRHCLQRLGDFIRVESGLLQVSEAALDWESKVDGALESVGTFLRKYRQAFQGKYRRKYYKNAKNHAWALFDAALMAGKQDNHQQAVEYYTSAIGFYPFSWFFNNRGNSNAALGQHREAIEDYDKAIEIDPQYAPLTTTGALRTPPWDSTEAIEDYDKAIEIDPQIAAYYNRGTATPPGRRSRTTTKPSRSTRSMQQAYSNRGNRKAALGQHGEAIEDYDKAIEIDPQYAAAYYNRGTAVRRPGTAPRGDRGLRQSHRDRPAVCSRLLQPGHCSTPPWDSTARRSRTTTKPSRSTRSMQPLTTTGALRTPPWDSTARRSRTTTKPSRSTRSMQQAYSNRGNSKAALGQHGEAIEDYDKAIEIDPQYAAAYSNRGNCSTPPWDSTARRSRTTTKPSRSTRSMQPLTTTGASAVRRPGTARRGDRGLRQSHRDRPAVCKCLLQQGLCVCPDGRFPIFLSLAGNCHSNGSQIY